MNKRPIDFERVKRATVRLDAYLANHPAAASAAFAGSLKYPEMIGFLPKAGPSQRFDFVLLGPSARISKTPPARCKDVSARRMCAFCSSPFKTGRPCFSAMYLLSFIFVFSPLSSPPGRPPGVFYLSIASSPARAIETNWSGSIKIPLPRHLNTCG